VADLLFERPRVTTGNLVFGDDGAPSADAVAEISGEFAPLVGALFSRVGTQAHVAGTFAPMVGVIAAAYDSNTQRPTVGQRVAPWQVADKPNQTGVAAGHRDGASAPTGWAAFWERAIGAPVGIEHRLPDVLKPAPVDRLGRFQDATGVHDGVGFLHQDATRAQAQRDGLFQDGRKVRDSTDFRHQDGDRTKRPSRLVMWQDGAALRAIRGTDFQGATPSPYGWTGRFQDGVPPPPGLSLRPVDPPKPPGCYTPSGELVFSWPWGHNGSSLVFQCGGYDLLPALVIVPVRRAYIVLNQITLHRVDTGAELRAHSFSMSLDHQSWTWSWNASLHQDAANHLGRESNGDPAELAVEVNGTPFRLRLERLARDRRFLPQQRWSVTGKGKAAILASPWAPNLSFGNPAGDRTAQQLVLDSLTINGVGIGWGIDWQLQDWHVPAGAWAMQGTYIDAINDIASAAGGYVQPHSTESILRILPRYPEAPWAWNDMTPDYDIPADAAEIEGTEFVDKPGYNRVFLGGVGAGVFGPFSRAGTAGNVIAPQVSHALITDAIAHRQRGIAELSDTGRQELVTLSMQVLPETGVIVPGMFVRYRGQKTVIGIVRGTSINWSSPKLRQSLEIETHA